MFGLELTEGKTTSKEVNIDRKNSSIVIVLLPPTNNGPVGRPQSKTTFKSRSTYLWLVQLEIRVENEYHRSYVYDYARVEEKEERKRWEGRRTERQRKGG